LDQRTPEIKKTTHYINGPHDDNEEDGKEGEEDDEACGKNGEEVYAEEAAEAAAQTAAAQTAAELVLISLPKSNRCDRLK
jgi:protein required for attachment to host cells